RRGESGVFAGEVGPIRNFVREVSFLHQTTNLSPNRMENWVFASHHSRVGRFHIFTTDERGL
ncbi:MAG: hypothetical protein ACK5PU_05585, partial [bacterium]